MRTPPLANPDPTNPQALTQSALSALQFANTWARKLGRFATSVTRAYVRHACSLLRLANSICAKRPESRP